MSSFMKTLIAKFDPNTEVVNELWAVGRGHGFHPHRAVSCTAHVRDGDVARVVLQRRYETPATELDFAGFLEALHEHHPHVGLAGIANDDAATKEMLRQAGITPLYVPQSRLLAAELVVPEGVTSDMLKAWQPLVYAAGATALSAANGVEWV